MNIKQVENGIEVTVTGTKEKKPWIAQLTGKDEQYIFTRTFMKRSSTNGNVVKYVLTEDGIYEIADKDGRTYIVIEDSNVRTIERSEAIEMLDKETEELEDEENVDENNDDDDDELTV